MMGSQAAFRAIEALNNVCRQEELKSGTPATSDNWPDSSLDAQQRFGQPHGKLFPFLGRKVRTPCGPGTLLQVFAERVTVLLDSQMSQCSFFRPAEIEPISWEV
jgi:hypothetical protein